MTSQRDPEKRRTLRRRLWQETLICVALFGGPALLLYPYTRWRPPAEFHATLRTGEVDFTLGVDYTGPPFFAAGRTDLAFEQLDSVKLPSGTSLKLRRIRFRNVEWRTLPLSQKTRVGLKWESSNPLGIGMAVRYSVSDSLAPPPAPVTVFVDQDSSAESDDGPLKLPPDGNVEIYPAKDRTITISLDPHVEPSVKPSQLTFDTSYPVYLLADSSVLFNRRTGSAIVGFNSLVDVLNAGRKKKVFQSQSLILANLDSKTRISDLKIGKAGIDVDVQGEAGTLKVDGEDLRPSPAEYLRSNGVLSTWLTTALLIGSAALTVASRFKLVKLLGKDG